MDFKTESIKFKKALKLASKKYGFKIIEHEPVFRGQEYGLTARIRHFEITIWRNGLRCYVGTTFTKKEALEIKRVLLKNLDGRLFPKTHFPIVINEKTDGFTSTRGLKSLFKTWKD